MTEDEKWYNEEVDAQSRMNYNRKKATIGMGVRRATDSNFNKRTYLPNPRPVRQDAEVNTIEQMILEEVKNYTAKNCDVKGRWKCKNLS